MSSVPSYRSSRGHADKLAFDDMLISGTAPDGGLFLPSFWPQLEATRFAAFATQSYPQSAAEILGQFVDDKSPLHAELPALTAAAYQQFSHPAHLPLHQIDAGSWMLELFHGPSLAFKDVALQLFSQLLNFHLQRRQHRMTLLAATSGDTGAAAVEAFGGHEAVDLFVLFPEGRISDLQRRQMTCSGHGNVFPLAIEGSFDDCQKIVKTLFADEGLVKRLSLGGVNSLNWIRLVAQIPYYCTAAAMLGSAARPVVFVVPTGNFGNVFAGFAAQQMGAPIDHFIIATNANDVVPQTLAHGLYRPAATIPTSAPAMDIQAPSNFERLLFAALGQDGEAVAALMDGLAQAGEIVIPEAALAFIRRHFSAHAASEAAIMAAMKHHYQASGVMIDPHSAAGLAALPDNRDDKPHIVLATAHPGKFPESVAQACDAPPQVPPALAALAGREEQSARMAADAGRVRDYMLDKGRAC